jgi:serine/threonine-protein kinase
MSDILERFKSALAGRYTIKHELGHGGMATAYLADDLRHNRKVAIKNFRPEFRPAIGTVPEG